MPEYRICYKEQAYKEAFVIADNIGDALRFVESGAMYDANCIDAHPEIRGFTSVDLNASDVIEVIVVERQ